MYVIAYYVYYITCIMEATAVFRTAHLTVAMVKVAAAINVEIDAFC